MKRLVDYPFYPYVGDGGWYYRHANCRSHQTDDGLRSVSFLRDARAETSLPAKRDNLIVKPGALRARKNNEWIERKLAQTNLFPLGQRMRGRERRHKRFLKDDFLAQIGAIHARANEAGVESPFAQQPKLVRGAKFEQCQLDLGKASVKGAQNRWQGSIKGRVHEANRKLADLALVRPACYAHSMIRLGKGAASLLQELLSRMRQAYFAPRALEKLQAKLAFQALDLLAEWRLGDVQLFGGPAEMQFVSYGDEVAQVAQFHEAIISLKS